MYERFQRLTIKDTYFTEISKYKEIIFKAFLEFKAFKGETMSYSQFNRFYGVKYKLTLIVIHHLLIHRSNSNSMN